MLRTFKVSKVCLFSVNIGNIPLTKALISINQSEQSFSLRCDSLLITPGDKKTFHTRQEAETFLKYRYIAAQPEREFIASILQFQP